MKGGDIFWYQKPQILIKQNRLTEFFPSAKLTLDENLNALMRFGLYASLLLIIYYRDFQFVYIAMGMAVITWFIHNSGLRLEKTKGVANPSRDWNLTAGNIEKLENVPQNSECTQPTIDNPFMNATMKDYMNIDEDGKIVDRPAACSSTDPDVKRTQDDYFNNNLYRDVDDVFGKMNSQRQFFTMPWTTIPNKQDEFAKWLYASPKTCKEDQDYCLKYEDVRAKAPVLMDPDRNPIN